MATKYGPNVLFCMPIRTNRILLLSRWSLSDLGPLVCGRESVSLVSFRHMVTHLDPPGLICCRAWVNRDPMSYCAWINGRWGVVKCFTYPCFMVRSKKKIPFTVPYLTRCCPMLCFPPSFTLTDVCLSVLLSCICLSVRMASARG
jgi:hypothetical protein